MTTISADRLVTAVGFRDAWDVEFSLTEGEKRLRWELASGEFDFFLSAGQNKFRSDASFAITRRGRRLTVMADICHIWKDIFDFGGSNWFDRHASVLEAQKGAKPFTWEARWRDDRQRAVLDLIWDDRELRGVRREMVTPLVPRL